MGSKAAKKKRKEGKAKMKEWGKLNANKPTDKALKKARKLMVQKTVEQMQNAPRPKPTRSIEEAIRSNRQTEPREEDVTVVDLSISGTSPRGAKG